MSVSPRRRGRTTTEPGRIPGTSALKGRVLSLLAVVLSGIGLFIATTLSLTRARGQIVPCGDSNGCAVVADSAYSQLLGLPVAYYGVAGYLVVLVLVVVSATSIRALHLSLVATALGTAVSCGLIAISFLLIHASCLWCLASSGTIAALLLVSLVRLRFPSSAPLWAQSAMAICVMALAWFGAGRIAAHSEHAILNQAILQTIPISDLAPDRSPSRGTPDAPITIIEFADFACPACRDIEGRLDKVFSHTAGVRLVFRNLPQPFIAGHEASGYGAVCGEIANEHGKFWPFAAQAFGTPEHLAKADYDRILRRLSISAEVGRRIANTNDIAVMKVNEDLALAHRLGLSVTPAFIVLSPDLPPRVGTNLNLGDILSRPEITRYLKIDS